MQIDYGPPYGDSYWYNLDSADWTDAVLSGSPGSMLTVEVKPIVSPADVAGVPDPWAPHEAVNLSWTPNSRDNEVMVVRRPSGTPVVDPPQGMPVWVGLTLGDGTVIFRDHAPSFTDNGLTPDTSYDYTFYSANNDFYSTGVEIQVHTDSCAPAAPINLAADPAPNVFTARWDAVEGATGYRIDVSPHPDFTVAPVVSTILRETMGSAPVTISVNDHEAADGFDNDQLTMKGNRSQAPTDVQSDTPSTGYVDPAGNPASGGANVFFADTSVRAFDITGIDATGYDDLRLNFGFRSEPGGGGIVLFVVWSLDDGLFQSTIIDPPLHTGMPPNAFDTAWHMVTNLPLPAAASQTNLMLRWVKHWTTGMRIDDVLLQGVNYPDPYVPGYRDLAVVDPQVVVTGLLENTTYYFRVRAEGLPGCTSPDSATAAVTTLVAPQNQTIDFPPMGDGLTGDTVGLHATASSGLPVSFLVGSGPASIAGGTNLTFSGAGVVSIVASQAGNANWNPAPGVTNTFTVTKASASVALLGLAQGYNGTPRVVTATTEPAGLTVVVTYDGSTTAPTSVGSYAVTGTVNDAMYQGRTNGTLVVQLPPTGMPIFSNSAPRYIVGSPRAESDFTQSGSSFLSSGISFWKSFVSNGPAMAFQGAAVAAAAARPVQRMKSRRVSAGLQPHVLESHEDESFWDDISG
jgi:hypothetical protein